MPGMVRDQNRYVEGDPLLLAGSAARGANGAGDVVAVGTAHTLRVTQTVTAAGATPSLTTTLQTSEDGVTWRALVAFAAATAPGSQRLSVSGLDRFVRASWAIVGTVTFSISGELV